MCTTHLMAPHSTIKIRERIIQLHLKGHSVKSISRTVKKPWKTVYGILKRIKDDGKLLRNEGSGRKPLLPLRSVNEIVRECKKDGKRSVFDIFLLQTPKKGLFHQQIQFAEF